MLVSIITICYNSEAVIRKTIESVLEQTYNSIEYLIIDGASRDNTIDIAEEYRTAFSERGYSYQIYSESDNGIYDADNDGRNMLQPGFDAVQALEVKDVG